MSSHQGLNIGPLLTQYEPDHLITKLYQSVELGGNGARYSIAHAEAARRHGCTVGGYVWLYAGIDGAIQVADALETAQLAGINISLNNPLWLDCEDYTDGTYPSLDTIRQAVDECHSRGTACGIYTGMWWWTDKAQDSHEFSYLPLWAAVYDGEATLIDPGFGGWTECAGHQYSGNPIDRSVFRAEFAS